MIPKTVQKLPTETPDSGQVHESASLPQLVTALTCVLGSTHVLYQKSLFYHWNVCGPNFYGLHKLFEEHYEALQTAGDVIAERIRALGYIAPGTLKGFLDVTAIHEDVEVPRSAAIMIRNLVDGHEICTGTARAAHAVAKKLADQVTMDLMVERMAFHEKTAWMLYAMLPQETKEQSIPIERL